VAGQDHRFDYGKGEAIAGFTQSTFLAGAAVVLALQSLERLFFPHPTASLNIGAWGDMTAARPLRIAFVSSSARFSGL
jgi:divalent metal cation (Fe/Co/Zn/Cd) transporter